MRVASLFILLFFMVSCTAQQKKVESVKTHFGNGKLRSITETLNGKKHGQEVMFNSNGDTLAVQHFMDDMLVDSFYQYKNGKIIMRGYCIPRTHAVIIDASDNQIVSEASFKASGVGDGIVKLYFKNGRVASVTEYKNGKKDGFCIMYYNDGKIWKILHYKDDLVIQPTVVYDSLGNTVR